jgi:hypothetical protein
MRVRIARRKTRPPRHSVPAHRSTRMRTPTERTRSQPSQPAQRTRTLASFIEISIEARTLRTNSVLLWAGHAGVVRGLRVAGAPLSHTPCRTRATRCAPPSLHAGRRRIAVKVRRQPPSDAMGHGCCARHYHSAWEAISNWDRPCHMWASARSAPWSLRPGS